MPDAVSPDDGLLAGLDEELEAVLAHRPAVAAREIRLLVHGALGRLTHQEQQDADLDPGIAGLRWLLNEARLAAATLADHHDREVHVELVQAGSRRVLRASVAGVPITFGRPPHVAVNAGQVAEDPAA